MKNIYKVLAVFLFCALSVVPLEARHIIGGEITYECTGPGNLPNTRNYLITMKVYRDCYGGGAQFDSPAPIGIYQRIGNDYSFFRQFNANLGSVSNINPDDNPCFILPPNVCVQEGIYMFEVTNLPIINGSYIISWQRCCRNNTINNILNPESTGATYTVEISAEAQQVCNSSPTFNGFPPIVICVNNSLAFDHSASDKEGDLLVYEFCAPLEGGGLRGSNELPGDRLACDGIMPSPINCLPPYSPVIFQAPQYSFQNPLGGDPLVVINPGSGLITGKPNLLGQFVVGVCVKEYRNGVLLSELRRDFQFNVANCEPTVRADVKADDVVNGQNYIINSCGSSTVQFVNESQLIQNIESYRWEFDLNGNIETVLTRDAEITFPGLGSYTGTMIINEGTECSDTADISVNVYPFIDADFNFTYDTCVGGPVSFTDMSTTGSGTMTSWNWDFGDSQVSSARNPNHLYQQPGKLPVKLMVEDINKCRDTSTQDISYFPVPPVIIIEPTTFDGCTPANITFVNLSVPIDSTYVISWDFGDGSQGFDISPSHIYPDAGTYDIFIEITSPIGCYTSAQFNDYIRVRSSPIADFIYTPEKPSNFNPTVAFTDLSIDASGWQWNFNSESSAFVENPVYTFQDTGFKTIDLIIFHENGCTDTAQAVIDVEPQVKYFLPNAFSPNEDGKNDLYKAKGVYDGISNFSLTIWSRWGEMLFETNDPNEGWNGRKFNQGEPLPLGVYVAAVKFTGPRREPYELKEFATLIR